MIRCDYSYAPDCSQCDEPYCRRDVYHSPNDWDEDWGEAFSAEPDY